MPKRTIAAGACVAAAVLVPGAPPAAAQSDGAASFAIGDLTCRDLLLQGGTDQELTISFLHGYAAGTAGRTEIDPDALVTATTRFLEACIEAPDRAAIKMLQDVLD